MLNSEDALRLADLLEIPENPGLHPPTPAHVNAAALWLERFQHLLQENPEAPPYRPPRFITPDFLDGTLDEPAIIFQWHNEHAYPEGTHVHVGTTSIDADKCLIIAVRDDGGTVTNPLYFKDPGLSIDPEDIETGEISPENALEIWTWLWTYEDVFSHEAPAEEEG